MSFLVHCDSQQELDRYWDAILKNGGKHQACGGIIDKDGLRWQISPTVLGEMITESTLDQCHSRWLGVCYDSTPSHREIFMAAK